MHKVFGTKEAAEYLNREGAYLIPCRNGHIGVVKTPKGYFFLGGGVEREESHAACLTRECLEEAGCVPHITKKLCSAEAYTKHPTLGYFHPIQTYYIGSLGGAEATPTENNHVLCWVPYEALRGQMFVEMQNWALEQFSAYVK